MGCQRQLTSKEHVHKQLEKSIWGRMVSVLPVAFVYPTCCNVMRTAALALVTSCNVNIDVYGKLEIGILIHLFSCSQQRAAEALNKTLSLPE